MSVRLLHGDSRELLLTMPECSVDAVVTDPPYELGFMGKKWDGTGIAYDPEFWAAVLRAMKPGAHLLAFGGTRTHHRVWCAIEDGGFEVRDTIGWLYASGFPKSHNGEWGGTALKPAWEPIIVARKPLAGTVEANWREHGTGALNVDGCRVVCAGESLGGGRISAKTEGWDRPWKHDSDAVAAAHARGKDSIARAEALGRWPANIIHDGSEEVLEVFPDAPGQLADVKFDAEERKTGNVYGALKRDHEPSADSDNEGLVGFKMKPGARRLDSGSAARFFYCAKPSRAERHTGMGAVPPQFSHGSTMRDAENVGTQRRGNHHPTVKPVDLMRYLCRLVTPKGGWCWIHSWAAARRRAPALPKASV